MGSRRQFWASESRLRAAGAALVGIVAFAALAVHSAACSPSTFVAGSPDASTAGEGGSPPLLVGLPDDAGAEAAADADACTPVGSGALGVLGCPCATVGASACAGNAQRQALLCQGGVWVANGRCPDGQLCNSTPGTNQGSCGMVAPQCAGATAGQTVCLDLWTAGQCDSDLLSVRPGDTCDNQVWSGHAASRLDGPRVPQHYRRTRSISTALDRPVDAGM